MTPAEIRREAARVLIMASSMAPLPVLARTLEDAQTLILFLRAVPPAWPSLATPATIRAALLDTADTLDSLALYIAAPIGSATD